MYWNRVLDEILNKENPNYPFLYTNLKETQLFEIFEHENKPKRHNKSYYLDGVCKDIYLTQREAECMFFLLRGHTIKSTAARLLLSPRTVEFYLKNIKKKLNIKKKAQVLNLISQTNFSQFASFEELSHDELLG